MDKKMFPYSMFFKVLEEIGEANIHYRYIYSSAHSYYTPLNRHTWQMMAKNIYISLKKSNGLFGRKKVDVKCIMDTRYETCWFVHVRKREEEDIC